MFRRSASLAIPHRKSFAAIVSLSLGSLGTRIAMSNCHTNRSVKLPSFRHFQEQFFMTNKENGRKTGLCSARLALLMFRWPLASHDSNRIRIAAASHDTMPLSCKNLDAIFLHTSGSFLLTVELHCLQWCLGAFFAYNWSLFCLQLELFFAYNWSFFAHGGIVPLISTWLDCKHSSSTVSNKSSNCKQKKKTSPKIKGKPTACV